MGKGHDSHWAWCKCPKTGSLYIVIAGLACKRPMTINTVPTLKLPILPQREIFITPIVTCNWMHILVRGRGFTTPVAFRDDDIVVGY
jgi:hypothetical protein